SPGVSRVAAAEPAAHPGDDLVVDGAAGARPVVGGRLARRTGAEQHHVVAGRGVVVAEVDDELVHADAPTDGPALALDPDLGGVARVSRHPVAVPERDEPDPGLG